MKEPVSLTLEILREIREDVRKIDRLDAKVDGMYAGLSAQIESLREVISGESVLGRYAAADVDRRLESLEKRVSTLEEQH
jgi:polyhydroxyalkanoate synthesis regulator phasin